jgi:hypothetical protein
MYIEEAYTEQQKTVDGTGKLTDATIPYLVFEALNEAEALGFAFQEIPKELEELKLLSVSISERKSEDIFLIEAVYGVSNAFASSDDEEEEEDAVVNFECSTGTGHITNAIKNITLKKGDIDPGSFIGWNGKTGDDSAITGVDILVPTLRESYTKNIKISKLTNAFRRKIAGLTGKINSKSFKGWDRGEVLFLGCSFSAPVRGAEKVIVTFNFAIQLNEENAEIQGTKFRKDGWTYVWSIAGTNINPGMTTPQNEVTGIYGSQVYQYADFGALGL